MSAAASALMLLVTATQVVSFGDPVICALVQYGCLGEEDSREQQLLDLKVHTDKDPNSFEQLISLEQYKALIQKGKVKRCEKLWKNCVFPDGVPNCWHNRSIAPTPQKIRLKKKAHIASLQCSVKRHKQPQCFRRNNFHR